LIIRHWLKNVDLFFFFRGGGGRQKNSNFLLLGGDGRNVLINFSEIFLVLRYFSIKRGENYGDEWYYKELD